MVTINDLNTFNTAIAEHDVCLINIGTDRCPPCITQVEIIESIELNYHDVYFINVNTDDAPEITDEYAVDDGILSIPVIIVTKLGNIDSKTHGLQFAEQLEERL